MENSLHIILLPKTAKGGCRNENHGPGIGGIVPDGASENAQNPEGARHQAEAGREHMAELPARHVLLARRRPRTPPGHPVDTPPHPSRGRRLISASLFGVSELILLIVLFFK